MDRSKKADAVAQLNEVFNQAGVVVVTRNLGLTVAQSTELRTKMREAGASYKVAKNRLAKLALKDTDYVGIEEFLSGPTALAWSEDPVAAAKAAVDFAKSNDKLEIVGGSMGTQVLDEAGIKALASMPSLDELRGKIVGLVNAPATKVAQVVNRRRKIETAAGNRLGRRAAIVVEFQGEAAGDQGVRRGVIGHIDKLGDDVGHVVERNAQQRCLGKGRNRKYDPGADRTQQA